ncbi:radical SAM protein [Pyrococcus abyssi]|uniref:radical SAM protein n=1 Tax=Pyrococcus abyssi TaxID=29292 RepID=UPI001E2F0A4C|nr:radical SAM protein [Pyrococcus abyssi]
MAAVEEAKSLATSGIFEGELSNIITVSKPPWVSEPHTGKLERIILLVGEGKGKFSEARGIPRSIGCLGNNKLLLYREKLSVSKFKRVIDEFKSLNPNGEVYVTNYDDINDAVEIAMHAARRGLKTYLIARAEDVPNVPEDRSFKLVGEYIYGEDGLDHLDKIDILMLVMRYKEYKSLIKEGIDFDGEIWIDILYPGSFKFLDFNPVEIRKIYNPSAMTYSPCMAGLIAISPEGFVTPCPLLRKIIVGDITKESLRKIVKKQKLRRFWKLTKDDIEPCSRCSFRYVCHDCRALEYQATGELFGMEFCPLLDFF